MKLKELSNVVMRDEIESITAYEAEAELFSTHPYGAEIKALFTKLADEKRARIKPLGRILKHSIGFRQRAFEPPKSIEAALRAHLTIEVNSAVHYTDLIKQLNKPEFKEMITSILESARKQALDVKALQALIKSKA